MQKSGCAFEPWVLNDSLAFEVLGWPSCCQSGDAGSMQMARAQQSLGFLELPEGPSAKRV